MARLEVTSSAVLPMLRRAQPRCPSYPHEPTWSAWLVTPVKYHNRNLAQVDWLAFMVG